MNCFVCKSEEIMMCKCRAKDFACSQGHRWMKCRKCKCVTIGEPEQQGHIQCSQCFVTTGEKRDDRRIYTLEQG